MATHVETEFLDDAERRYAEELGRLRLLLEASATLLGSLDIEAMLPEVLALAGRTLAADAYSVWQVDDATGIWSVGARDGLSDEYVASAMEAIRNNTATVSLDGPIDARRPCLGSWPCVRFAPSRMPSCVLALVGAGAPARPARPEPGPGGGTGVASTGSVKRLEVTVTGTTVTPAPAQVDLPVGSTLELVVTSDHDDELHAHGFDVEADAQGRRADDPARSPARRPASTRSRPHDPALTLLTVAVR